MIFQAIIHSLEKRTNPAVYDGNVSFAMLLGAPTIIPYDGIRPELRSDRQFCEETFPRFVEMTKRQSRGSAQGIVDDFVRLDFCDRETVNEIPLVRSKAALFALQLPLVSPRCTLLASALVV